MFLSINRKVWGKNQSREACGVGVLKGYQASVSELGLE